MFKQPRYPSCDETRYSSLIPAPHPLPAAWPAWSGRTQWATQPRLSGGQKYKHRTLTELLVFVPALLSVHQFQHSTQLKTILLGLSSLVVAFSQSFSDSLTSSSILPSNVQLLFVSQLSPPTHLFTTAWLINQFSFWIIKFTVFLLCVFLHKIGFTFLLLKFCQCAFSSMPVKTAGNDLTSWAMLPG